MNYYDLAIRNIKAVNDLINSDNFIQAVYFSCLTIEYLLKSKLDYVEHEESLEQSHDVVNLLRSYTRKYPTSKDLKFINRIRKYFNESRYPSSNIDDIDKIYNKDFALEFYKYINIIKNYIDNDVIINLDEIANKFNKK